VLVTGAAGHIGNNIVRELLARGRTVRMLEHVESGSLDGLSVEKRRGVRRRRGRLSLRRDRLDRAYA
jgi:nucleoside-diphosphate-sugar epimerase